ncbi:MAG: type II toxin-antitoxin system VapB family antitoxin [Planctomycetes bacterium]|nr:type II toxin-antitoxin system VapB family antitoxin [Planctomycetota bacterium]
MSTKRVEVDEALIRRVMKILGVRTKREAAELALRRAVERAEAYAALRKLRGKLHWEGDINAWRKSRV